MEGQYPSSVNALTIAGKYMTTIPVAKAPNYHSDSAAETAGALTALADGGGWFYVNAATDANVGNVFVRCTHTDTKGSIWSGY
jgi:hypothetical protein